MKTEESYIGAYDKNIALIKDYRRGKREAGEELCELNRPLVYKIASRFTSRGVDFEELCEAGSIGLVKAINTFDIDRGCAFSTYAVPLIFGEIRRFLRDDGIIKVSREEKKLSALLGAERERRLGMGERCDIDSLARAVGVSRADAAAAMFSSSPVRSLDEEIYEEEGHTLADSVFDDEEQRRGFDSLAIKLALEKLSEVDRKLIILRYFRDLTQVEVAKIMGLTQVKVSRMEKKILAFLHRDLSE